ncbi:MAG: leucyl/phenylalanyl-tRNA--protein transferase [Gammaproteobacteria bacterium]|nr:MAG: leucyl/phenylalanyl-tRNA--protein transferase [Gammaproteobacteria bacterium]
MEEPIWLDQDIWFPKPDHAMTNPNGLLAAGGDLSTERLLFAYANGIFPWYEECQPILWWSPNPRCIIIPDELHISRSMRKHLNKREYTVRIDTQFEQVISHCASPRGYSDKTWITDAMIQAYTQLHNQGHCHCFEVFHGNKLVGGLYGIAIGPCFFGESMFSLATNASKVAFIYLVKQLECWGFSLIDCQLENDHLLTMGCKSIPRSTFLSILDEEIKKPPPGNTWKLTWQW